MTQKLHFRAGAYFCGPPSRVISRGTRRNVVPIVEKLPERTGAAAFPLLECIRTHCGRHCEPFSGQNVARLQDFACTISKFSGNDIPRHRQKHSPGAWTQTPISAWLTVPDLRNDYCHRPLSEAMAHCTARTFSSFVGAPLERRMTSGQWFLHRRETRSLALTACRNVELCKPRTHNIMLTFIIELTGVVRWLSG